MNINVVNNVIDVSYLLVLFIWSWLLFNFVKIDKFTLLFRDCDLIKILFLWMEKVNHGGG